MMSLRRVAFLVGIAWSCFHSSLVQAQQLLWTKDGKKYQDGLGGNLAFSPDVDGDHRDDLLVGAPYVDCSGADDGKIEVHRGVAGGIVSEWCGEQEDVAACDYVRDVDGDGVPDIVCSGTRYHDAKIGYDVGRITLFSGASGNPIWHLVGEQPNDRFGEQLARLGDVDGDGFDEFVASSSEEGVLDRGRVYVISSRDAHVVRTHTGTQNDERIGYRVAVLGDVDGDGISDYAYQTQLDIDFIRGRIDVCSGATGALIWSKKGDKYDGLGIWMCSVGDWNDDGHADLLAFVGKGDGMLRVYSPATDQLLYELSYTHLNYRYDDWGHSLAHVGDVDGDGVDEFAVGAKADRHDGIDAGRVDLYSGRTMRPLYRFYPGYSRGWFGFGLAGGGDVDGDGIPDLAIGAPMERSSAPKGGRAFVYSLKELFLQAEPNDPVDGDTVTVDLRGGVPGALGMIELIDVSGTPMEAPLLVEAFDGNGELQLTADVDSSVSGESFTIVGYSVNWKGKGPLKVSLTETIAVQ